MERLTCVLALAAAAPVLCIHRYEGAWNASTGYGYLGGLQMDADFERSYGREFLSM